uniref:Retrovirus-related Pol polyprotein from transposon TNT 1-94 n=1 Tax=Tanacetum cinerariifolium TaxID=118510 RepID=A0A6L2MJY4_TANCI|nr:retrovirus-related Pol polyprotein from transposon TNT 1-94 [Tanacetum cinerariifolium]
MDRAVRHDHEVWHEPELSSLAQSLIISLWDKEVNQAAKVPDDSLVSCVENTFEDRIIDSGASFQATYCKEELERFKLRSTKIRLAYDKTLDIAGVRDVILNTFFGFKYQQRKVTKCSLVIAHGNKGGSCIWLRIGMKTLASKEEGFLHNVREDKKTVEAATGVAIGNNANLQVKCLMFDNGGEYSSLPIKFCVKNGIVMLKIVLETPLQFGVAERLSRTFNSSSLTKPIQKSQVVLVYIPENLVDNDSIVAEHGLSLVITQSPGGSSDTSEGSENSRSFEDSGRSDEEDSEDRASSKEGSFEHVRRSNRESRAPVRYSLSAKYLLLTKNGEQESYSEALSSKECVQRKKAINEEMVSLEKNQTCSLVRLQAGNKAS